MTHRISLSAGQFAALVRGEVVRIDSGTVVHPVVVEIGIKDIGFDAMQSALDAAQMNQNLKKSR